MKKIGKLLSLTKKRQIPQLDENRQITQLDEIGKLLSLIVQNRQIPQLDEIGKLLSLTKKGKLLSLLELSDYSTIDIIQYYQYELVRSEHFKLNNDPD